MPFTLFLLKPSKKTQLALAQTRARLRHILADLRMSGALEAFDTTPQGVDGGTLTAPDEIEHLLAAQIQDRPPSPWPHRRDALLSTDDAPLRACLDRTYRTEVLNAHLVESVAELRALTDAWLIVYNRERPHDSLGRVPPLTFLPRPSSGGQSPHPLST